MSTKISCPDKETCGGANSPYPVIIKGFKGVPVHMITINNEALINRLLLEPEEITLGNGNPPSDPRNDMFLELYVRDITSDAIINHIDLSLLDQVGYSIFVYPTELIINPGIHMRYMGFSSAVYNSILFSNHSLSLAMLLPKLIN